MQSIQRRLGALLVVTGITLAFTISAGLAFVVGPAFIVAGGMVLALAAEPMLEEVSPARVSDVIDRPDDLAA